MNEDETKPDILYHYTSIDAFRNIMESKIMHATRYDQMNDFSEVRLGIDKLLEAISNYNIDHSFLDLKKFLISVIKSFKKDTLDIYILSLSSVADSIDQWRAYAPNGGVSIGFDRKMIMKGFLTEFTQNIGRDKIDKFKIPDPSSQLMRCIYTDKNGNLDLHSIVKNRFFKPNSYNAMFKSQNKVVKIFFRASLPVTIYQTICSIKHGAYDSEREWRCVNYRPNLHDYPVKLNENNRWYIEMEFDPNDYIKEIWISPHGDKKSCKNVIDYLRSKYDLKFVVKNSQIPFRGS